MQATHATMAQESESEQSGEGDENDWFDESEYERGTDDYEWRMPMDVSFKRVHNHHEKKNHKKHHHH